MVSERTASNAELSEFVCPHRVAGRELREFLSALFVCKSEPTEFFTELTEFAPKLSEFSLPKQHSRNIFRPALSGDMDWWRMEWPFSRVQNHFSEAEFPGKSLKLCRESDFGQISGSEI